MTKFFYRDAVIAILVYDITRKNTFEELKNYWIDELKKEGGADTGNFDYLLINIVLGIAGNKSDLAYEKEEVSEVEARSFAESKGVYFKLVSALNNVSIDDMFINLVTIFDEKAENFKNKGNNQKLSRQTNKEKKKCCK